MLRPCRTVQGDESVAIRSVEDQIGPYSTQEFVHRLILEYCAVRSNGSFRLVIETVGGNRNTLKL